ncbi:hypothetical protein [Halalkalirubrum salinum]|uniref:hypothetical protein n=1 Tax=Halalkalirubrum salinum TaxID=2563889 RepID=UPI0010FB4E9F|nr:hypothetical protein [Halalkalirubrum salinum]
MTAIDPSLHRAIAQLTNKRQASKILDIRSSSLLVCRKPGYSVYIGNCGECHAIWLHRGTYCDDRHISIPQLLAIGQGYDTVDVDQSPSSKIRRILSECGVDQ